MPETTHRPTVRPGGLVAVAYLKAQLDEGSDHLGIFVPLLLDALATLPAQSFTAADAQDALAKRHGVAMPQQTVATLLKRATRQKYVVREVGRYRLVPTERLPASDVSARKARIEAGQRRLADALREHAARRSLQVESTDATLDMLFRFLEDQQVALLLDNPPPPPDGHDGSRRESAIVAEFVFHSVRSDPASVEVLRGMLEGLVLYHAAFLPDLSVASRRFRDLRVVFDSTLVRQALGYEGTAMQALIRECVDLLKASGVQRLVLDKTIHEIQRILAMYEGRLATAQGRSSLRPVPMARHFLTQRYRPSDIREMSALVEREVVAAGFQVMSAPRRVAEYTAGEQALAARLADPTTKDELQPRVVHDVDCVATILTMRRGHRSASLDDAKAVFATSSPLVIRNTRLWWEQDEHEAGVAPVVHIRGLANLAWLKKPSLCSDFKIRELVALCTAGLRPSQETWNRFLRHLDSLQRSEKLSSDDVTAILVSAMSDRLLRDLDLEEEDPADIDAASLDEVVERVIASYGAEADDRIRAVTDEYEQRLAESQAQADRAKARADAADRRLAESERRRGLVAEGRARSWARLVSAGLKWAVVAVATAGAVALIARYPFHAGWVGVAAGVGVVCFVTLELVGVLRHLSELRASCELALTRRLRNWLEADSSDGTEPTQE